MRASDGFDAAEVLLLVVPGSGATGFGCWSTHAFRDKEPEKGSVVPVLKEALQRGWGCVLTGNVPSHMLSMSFLRVCDSPHARRVVDPNNNIDERGRPRPSSSSPEEHVIAAWDTVVAPSAARHVFIMAHSTGGEAVVGMFGQRPEARPRVLSYGFADSVHKVVPDDAADIMKGCGCNFVCSRAPLGDPKPKPWIKNGFSNGCAVKSAGTTEHLETPHAAAPAILAMFDEALAAAGGFSGDV